MSNNSFQFEGGEYLTDMGATWFVSYKYHKLCDKSHMLWDTVSVWRRIPAYEASGEYHKLWLEKILHMNNKKLNTNELGLDAYETKKMAKLILEKNYSEKKPFAILIKQQKTP